MDQTEYRPTPAAFLAIAAVIVVLTSAGLYLIEELLRIEMGAHWGLAGFPVAVVLMFIAWRRLQRTDAVDMLAAVAFVIGADIVVGVIYAIVGLSAGSLWAMAEVIMSMLVSVRAISLQLPVSGYCQSARRAGFSVGSPFCNIDPFVSSGAPEL